MTRHLASQKVCRYVIITGRGEAFIVTAASRSEAQTYFHLKQAGAVIASIFEAEEL